MTDLSQHVVWSEWFLRNLVRDLRSRVSVERRGVPWRPKAPSPTANTNNPNHIISPKI